MVGTIITGNYVVDNVSQLDGACIVCLLSLRNSSLSSKLEFGYSTGIDKEKIKEGMEIIIKRDIKRDINPIIDVCRHLELIKIYGIGVGYNNPITNYIITDEGLKLLEEKGY